MIFGKRKADTSEPHICVIPEDGKKEKVTS